MHFHPNSARTARCARFKNGSPKYSINPIAKKGSLPDFPNSRIISNHKPANIFFADDPLYFPSTKSPLYPWLNSEQLMDIILVALENKKPCSIISVGATEAFIMAQYTIYSEEVFMKHPEAYVANQGMKSGFQHRGIRFPNIHARDSAVEAVKKADIIGYNTIVESARSFAEKVFAAYGIQPRLTFEANLRRVIMFSQQEKYETLLKGRKILLISSLAEEAKTAMERKYQSELEIVGTIPIWEYEEIPYVKKQLLQYDFDLCLLAAGINAVILAPYISEHLGKVAFDIGWGMKSLITGEIFVDEWLTSIIGIKNIMKM